MKRLVAIASLVLCAATILAAVVALLKLRFEAGDVYAPYSTLRADPLGAMALYESLQRMPGISVQRDFHAANRLPDGWDTTYVQLAGEKSLWRKLPEDAVRTIERFMIEGGRFVIALSPQNRDDFNHEKKTGASEDQEKSKEEKHSQNEHDWISLSDRWDFEFGFEPLKSEGDGSVRVALVENVSGLPLPPELQWHSGVVIEILGPSWRTIYSRDGKPTVVERKFGQGGMVLATDSYFASNQAMLNDPHADLLAWLVGPNRRVMFEESHFGIVDAPGIATLVRKYRLHGVIVALFILAGLFSWKNAFSLSQETGAVDPEVAARGRDSAAGFVSLLRRNIKPDRLLDVCTAEWSKAFAVAKNVSRQKAIVEAIVRQEQAKPARDRNTLETYRRICQAVKSRKKLTP